MVEEDKVCLTQRRRPSTCHLRATTNRLFDFLLRHPALEPDLVATTYIWRPWSLSLAVDQWDWLPASVATMIVSCHLRLLTILSILPFVCFAAKDRDFVAARKHDSLRRRDGSLEPRHDGQTLMYANGMLRSCLCLACADSADEESSLQQELSFDPGRRC